LLRFVSAQSAEVAEASGPTVREALQAYLRSPYTVQDFDEWYWGCHGDREPKYLWDVKQTMKDWTDGKERSSIKAADWSQSGCVGEATRPALGSILAVSERPTTRNFAVQSAV